MEKKETNATKQNKEVEEKLTSIFCRFFWESKALDMDSFQKHFNFYCLRLRRNLERPSSFQRATHEQQTSGCRSVISEIKHKLGSLTIAAANFFLPIASVRLAPIATLASTSFANPAFSLLAVVAVRSLGGIQLQTGEVIEISLPVPHHDTQGQYGKKCPIFRSLIPLNPTLAPTRPWFIMPLNTKSFLCSYQCGC
jgi:hypothetical protein